VTGTELPFAVGAFATIFGTIFVAELTDKDALLLLTLATRSKPRRVFLAGSIAFTFTTAVIVTVGSALIRVVPVVWIKAAGGAIMLGYAGWTYARGVAGGELEGREEKHFAESRSDFAWLMGAVMSLALLDLAGDATELITIVFVAQFKDAVLVFVAALVALVLASGLETALGNRLGRILSTSSVRRLSVVVFLIVGSAILLSIAAG